eukprot:Polyplicarium_translucidae@DN2724_c0_g1_i1.p1
MKLDGRWAKLAVSRDLKKRAEALCSVRAWIRDNQSPKAEDLSKVCQVLFYALYMADRAVWKDLSLELSGLAREFQMDGAFLRFIDCLLAILALNWTRADVHRMSKLQMFVRHLQREMLNRLRASNWNTGLATEIAAMLSGPPLELGCASHKSPGPAGLAVHFADTFAIEMKTAFAECAPAEDATTATDCDARDTCMLIVVEPFLRAVAATGSLALMDAITTSTLPRLENWFPQAELCVRLFHICAFKQLAPENARRLFGVLGQLDSEFNTAPCGVAAPSYNLVLENGPKVQPRSNSRKARRQPPAMFKGEDDFLSVATHLKDFVRPKTDGPLAFAADCQPSSVPAEAASCPHAVSVSHVMEERGTRAVFDDGDDGEEHCEPLAEQCGAEFSTTNACAPRETTTPRRAEPLRRKRLEQRASAMGRKRKVPDPSLASAADEVLFSSQFLEEDAPPSRNAEDATEAAAEEGITPPPPGKRRKVNFAPKSAASVYEYSEARPVVRRSKPLAVDHPPNQDIAPGKAILKKRDDPRVIRKRLIVARHFNAKKLALHTKRNGKHSTRFARQLARAVLASALTAL